MLRGRYRECARCRSALRTQSFPELPRIRPALDQPQQALLHPRMILAIRHAEPGVARTQNLHACLTALNQRIDHTRYVALGAQVVRIPLQKSLELFVKLPEDLRRKAPHV